MNTSPSQWGKTDARKAWAIAAGIAVLTFIAYAASLNFGFVYDDHVQIVDDPYITSWEYLPQYFYRPLSSSYFRPLFMVWLLLNQKVFGLNPFGWHLTTVLMHVAATLTVFFLARRLTNEDRIAGLVGLLFGVHPIHIESVAWISGVTDPMATALILGSFLAWLRAQQGRKAWLGIAYLAAAGALLSKETAVMLPLLPMVWTLTQRDFATRREALFAASKAAAPFAMLALAFLGLRAAVLAHVPPALIQFHWPEMIFTLPKVLLLYVAHLLWPAGLTIFYDIEPLHSPTPVGFWGALAAVIAILSGLVWCYRRTRNKVVRFGLAFLPIFLAPVLYLRNATDIFHDRYLYIPSVGFCIVLGWLLHKVTSYERTPWHPATLKVVVILPLTALFLFQTYAEQLFYRSDLLLFYRAVTISPNSANALNDYGGALASKQMFGQALEFFRRAVERNPKFWLAQLNVGVALRQLNRLAEADKELDRAIALNPNFSGTYFQKAIVKAKLGEMDAALRYQLRAVEIQPKNPDYFLLLGLLYEVNGNKTGATQAYRNMQQLDPASAVPQDALRRLAEMK